MKSLKRKRHCRIEDSHYGVILNCREYKIHIEVAKVGSKNWIDIIADVANCNDPRCIKRALQVSGKIAFHIEENILKTLVPRNTSYFSKLNEILSGISLSLNVLPLPSVGLQISQRQAEQNDTRQVENTSKEEPGVLTVKIGSFTRIMVNFRRGTHY